MEILISWGALGPNLVFFQRSSKDTFIFNSLLLRVLWGCLRELFWLQLVLNVGTVLGCSFILQFKMT